MGESSRGRFAPPVGPLKKMKTSNLSFEEYKKEYLDTTSWRGSVSAKLDAAAPFCFFLTRVKDSAATFHEDLSITFPELLDSSLGDLEHSVHINFMVELPWLLAQYAVTGKINPSMTILYGVESGDLTDLPSHLKVTALHVRSPFPFGHHHTKMSIFYYKDRSLRFAIYTANLIESDWDNRTQGVWISPLCQYMGDEVPINYGESETFFKVDVIKYLSFYRRPEMREWLRRIQVADLSAIRVFLVASVPCEDSEKRFGLGKLSKLLKEHVRSANTASWKLVVQCSSIGSLGKTPETWLFGDFARSLVERVSNLNFRVEVIYPCVADVKASHDGMLGGACLPYQSSTHQRQPWLNKCLNKWRSRGRHRSQAVPHIKSYTKLSPDGNQVAWFLLTSANLSKSAWGSTLKSGAVKPLSFEAGVLFLPKFLTGKDVFPVKKDGNFSAGSKGDFPLPYDGILTKYDPTDHIFLYDKCFDC